MALLDDFDKTYNPLRKVGDAMTVGDAVKTEPLSGQSAADEARKEAMAAGNTAQQEAVKRAKEEE
jgi:hypothetical protein